jgi:predicted DNA-binding transcriptional regulator YafY
MIRFAAANRLCVNLDYIDQHGSRSTPLIEPYSLRRTRAGDVLLYAVRVDDGQDRSYRLDRILGAQIVQRTRLGRLLGKMGEWLYRHPAYDVCRDKRVR